MNVLLLGGSGTFGSRLATLLRRDGHEVTIAGRNMEAAQRVAQDIGASAQRLDRTGRLEGLGEYDVLIDAAGPFHSYGTDHGTDHSNDHCNDPYRLPRAAIKAGTHYLDLADNAAFCAGITELNDLATKAGVCVMSGLSSVPALSSAAVIALSDGQTPRVIDSAILPGNRAPRGHAVMASILSQAGQVMPVWRGGRWERAFGWSDPATYILPGGLRRQAWQISVPDQRLFPAAFNAESVLFRAGLELGVMRYGLAAFALLQRVFRVPVNDFVVGLFRRMADLLAPFGTGRGGMSVMVVIGTERRFWRLLAEDGNGPYIPAIPARALLRRAALPTGARPAIGAITLEEAETAMSDLQVRTEQQVESQDPIFVQVLGQQFSHLPAAIQETHRTVDRSVWVGQSDVARGQSLWARCLGWIFRFPAAGQDIGVRVTKTVTEQGETWLREFAGSKFRSYLSVRDGRMHERFGPFSFAIGLKVADEALHYPVTSGHLGPVRLPRWLLPVSEAREYQVDGGFRFDVQLRAPVTGKLIVRYQGMLSASPPGDPLIPVVEQAKDR